MRLAVGVERLAALVDLAGELDGDERQQWATQALDRFERYILRSPTGCHLWTGFVTADGYGQFSLSGRLHLARRVAYELWVGPIEPNERVFSTCGVRACVNFSPPGGASGGPPHAPERPIHP